MTTPDQLGSLTADEEETWRAVNRLLARLPSALGADLQCGAGLSYLEYYVLAGLSEQPDRTVRMSTLAALTHAELSRLSHLISRLERRGFVRREPDPRDGRFTNAILTETGFDHLVRSTPGHVAKVRDLVFDVLDVDEQHALRDAARKITARLNSGSC